MKQHFTVDCLNSDIRCRRAGLNTQSGKLVHLYLLYVILALQAKSNISDFLTLTNSQNNTCILPWPDVAALSLTITPIVMLPGLAGMIEVYMTGTMAIMAIGATAGIVNTVDPVINIHNSTTGASTQIPTVDIMGTTITGPRITPGVREEVVGDVLDSAEQRMLKCGVLGSQAAKCSL